MYVEKTYHFSFLSVLSFILKLKINTGFLKFEFLFNNFVRYNICSITVSTPNIGGLKT